MGWRTMVSGWLVVVAACATPSEAPTEVVTLFEGARLIVGDESPPIENAAFVVEGDRFRRIGRSGEIQTPAGAVRVDLSGKTVMPALIDAHSHIGYMKGLSSGPENYTREHILDHMYRFAIIDEAHRNDMRVLAHATDLEDAKALLRAGVDAFGHMVTDVDDELIALFQQRPHTGILLAQVGRRMIHAPYLDPPDHSLLETVTPAQIARLRDRVQSQTPEELERARENWGRTAENIIKLHDAGVRIAIGSDGGGQGGDRFIGFTAHTELENVVAAGMTPAEAIVAGTKNGAEILGHGDELGTIAAGKSDAPPPQQPRWRRRARLL